jgi:hypothetical protein
LPQQSRKQQCRVSFLRQGRVRLHAEPPGDIRTVPRYCFARFGDAVKCPTRKHQHSELVIAQFKDPQDVNPPRRSAPAEVAWRLLNALSKYAFRFSHLVSCSECRRPIRLFGL